jgi:hypothetical protein
MLKTKIPIIFSITPKDFNSYGSIRGNDDKYDIMINQ